MATKSKAFEHVLGDSTSVVTEALQASLYDLLALGKILKQAHWNVRGRNFKPIHEHLDEIYEAVEEATDTFAERVTALGESPSGQVAQIVEHTSLKPIPTGFIADGEVVKLIVDRVGATVVVLRENMLKTEDADPVTADLFHAVVADLEKHLWMLRSQLD